MPFTFTSFRSTLPGSGHRVDVLLMLLGGLLGLCRYPLVLLAFGPFRWMTSLYAMSAQESRFGALPSGDGGLARGMLHFHTLNPLVVEGGKDWRDSAFWQGWYACAFISRALTVNWRWWGMAVPGLGFGVLRWVWTHGASDESAVEMTAGDSNGWNLWTYQSTQSTAWSVWVVWRTATTVLLTAPALAGIGAFWRRRK